MHYLPHWIVNGERTSSQFDAWRAASKLGTMPHFYFYETEFDALDWTKEPTETWDQLLDRRAQQIAAKGKPIVLNFSGGTDSYTIYKVFERNNIHIDEIIIRVGFKNPTDRVAVTTYFVNAAVDAIRIYEKIGKTFEIAA